MFFLGRHSFTPLVTGSACLVGHGSETPPRFETGTLSFLRSHRPRLPPSSSTVFYMPPPGPRLSTGDVPLTRPLVPNNAPPEPSVVRSGPFTVTSGPDLLPEAHPKRSQRLFCYCPSSFIQVPRVPTDTTQTWQRERVPLQFHCTRRTQTQSSRSDEHVSTLTSVIGVRGGRPLSYPHARGSLRTG